ncbi:MAG: hypothetical protein JXA77_01350 [Bacteroidales bacterium]|nr:hypothetical protein [Bacteroidales bacterium]MBN2820173.1 hypothetical protein [Bacteroidales bacterium]
MKNKILTLIVVSLISYNSFSQIKGVADMLGSGTENAEALFEAYLSPWTNAFGASLNGGWYNTAKPHKLGGFDITMSFNAAIIPDLDKTFDLSGLGLSGMSFPEGSMSSTAAGPRDGGKPMIYTPNAAYPQASVPINAPNGTGVGFIPLPTAQIGVGFIKETDLNFRYMPEVSLGDIGNMKLWGIGVKHSIKQWIPVLAKVPVFQLSAQGGYTKFSTNLGINLTPDAFGDDYSSLGTGNYNDQNFGFEVSSFTANILVGANLPVVCFYGGLGFATTKANLTLTGNFPIPDVDTETGHRIINDITDPINAEMTNSDGSKTKPRLNVGMRIKLGVITFHGDYTYANYSVATGGIGISFR